MYYLKYIPRLGQSENFLTQSKQSITQNWRFYKKVHIYIFKNIPLLFVVRK